MSGPDAGELVRRTVTVRGSPLDPPGERTLFDGRFHDGRGTQPVLVLWWPGPRSYTREDVAEFHLPGAPPLLAAALERLLALGAAPAAPGEFTRRAFENGRIDLTRAEGVLELIHASSEAGARAGVALLAGGLDRRVASVRDRLEELRSLCEASLDFDESDTGHVPADELARLGETALAALDEALSWEERREPASGAPRVELFGAPNAGKSTLFNALTGDDGALVADRAGTTRDRVRGELYLGGVAVELFDAPGLDAEAGSEPDRLAQELAARDRGGADALLWLADGSRATAEDLEAERATLPDAPLVRVWNKVDEPAARPAPAGWLAASARAERGLDAVRDALAEVLGLGEGSFAAGGAGLGRDLSARHRTALGEGRAALASALGELADGAPLDFAAESLRAATDALDGILGRTTPDDLLDRIFARFCIGK